MAVVADDPADAAHQAGPRRRAARAASGPASQCGLVDLGVGQRDPEDVLDKIAARTAASPGTVTERPKAS